MKRSVVITLVLIVQLLCAVFFVGQILASIFGLDIGPIDWAVYEWIEIGASVGLVVGVVVGAVMLRDSLRRARKAELIVSEVSGAFMDLIHRRFDEWGLSPAQRDVALFMIKGFNTAEMAEFRGTSEGTIKAQTNAIYRKADVSNRAQLVSLLIDDLLQDNVLPQQPDFKQ